MPHQPYQWSTDYVDEDKCCSACDDPDPMALTFPCPDMVEQCTTILESCHDAVRLQERVQEEESTLDQLLTGFKVDSAGCFSFCSEVIKRGSLNMGSSASMNGSICMVCSQSSF